MDYGWMCQATVVRVVDGDTFFCDLDQGWYTWRRKQYVRVSNFNAPEQKTPEGAAATTYAEQLIQPGTQIWIRSVKLYKDRYNRVDAEVYFLDPTSQTWENFAERMISAGYGVAQ